MPALSHIILHRLAMPETHQQWGIANQDVVVSKKGRLSCRRKIETTPGAQSRDDPRVGGAHDERDLDCIPAAKLSSAFDCHAGSGLRYVLSVTGEAEAGSAGEQPAEE